MCLIQYAEEPEPEEPEPAAPGHADPEPVERVPAGLLYVPVRPGTREVTLRMFRTPLGHRTAVGFTRTELLAATLGPHAPWIRLSASALRALAAPLGASLLTIDPTYSAPAATPVPERTGSGRSVVRAL
ncbi:SAV_915 family protein [Streptomyces sp. NPDC056491]|uniref:SAV_915 family protein n=1 Tax=Streptomyces sp. NPDC056491 TaxID=3345837 RepID=UPI00367B34C2